MESDNKKMNMLFLCTGNSCRSQMAEGWAKHLKGDKFESYSAGIAIRELNPNAVKVMAEAGVDISKHQPKLLSSLDDISFDVVIAVCGHAYERCSVYPKNAKIIYQGFDDPPKLAQKSISEEESLIHYRRVRNEIKEYVMKLPEILSK